jgi:hypothetical protein
MYVVTNKNDIAFPVKEVAWFIALDGDEQGRREGRDVALRLVGEFDVEMANIRVIDPPKGYETINPHWDDADNLPNGTNDNQRIDQIIDAVQWLNHPLYAVEIVLRNDRFDANITAIENALVASGRGFFQHLG